MNRKISPRFSPPPSPPPCAIWNQKERQHYPTRRHTNPGIHQLASAVLIDLTFVFGPEPHSFSHYVNSSLVFQTWRSYATLQLQEHQISSGFSIINSPRSMRINYKGENFETRRKVPGVNRACSSSENYPFQSICNLISHTRGTFPVC